MGIYLGTNAFNGGGGSGGGASLPEQVHIEPQEMAIT